MPKGKFTRKRELKRLVEQKVAEVMAERDALFERFFRSRLVARELRKARKRILAKLEEGC